MNAVRPVQNVIVERARAEHLAEIVALANNVWRAHYPGIISSAQIDYMLARMYDLNVLQGELASGIHFDRALVDGTLRGFSSHGPTDVPGEIKLHKLYIHPDWQRRRLGHALLKACELHGRSTGARMLVLNVNRRNEHAIAAYQKHGFTIRESVVVDIGDGFVMDDYEMTRAL